MTESDVRELAKTTAFKQFWRELAKNEMFLAGLMLCETKKGDFDERKPPSEIPHIHNERRGGQRGWDKLRYLLLTIGGQSENQDGSDEEESGLEMKEFAEVATRFTQRK